MLGDSFLKQRLIQKKSKRTSGLIIGLILFANFIYPVQSECSMIQEDWLKTVVLIEQEAKNEKGQSQIIPIGTGFLLRSERGFYYVVTCKHVVRKKGRLNKEGLFYRLNTRSFIDDPFHRRSINALLEELEVDYFLHPDDRVDIAVFPIKVDVRKDDIKFATFSIFEELENIYPREDVFFIGYPIGTVLSERNQPVVRNGIISRKNEDFRFLIEGASFPGNSGSPVITKSLPYTYNREKKLFNLKEVKQARFIGIIYQQIRYRESAISPQTGNVRVIFEENTGLSKVIPSNFIKDILESEPVKAYEKREAGKRLKH